MQTLSLGPVSVDRDALALVCRKWGIGSVALFGSALRDDFSPQSDIDLLIEYLPGTRHSLFQYGYMNDDFERVFGRKVDLVRAAGLRTSRNEIRKQNIFSSAKPLYVANA
jgi:predicted nucleotidyltransferase